MGVLPGSIQPILDGWIVPPDGTGRAVETLRSQVAILSARDATGEWPTSVAESARLRSGVYTPIQLILWRCAEASGDRLEGEFPFLLGLVAQVAHLTLESAKEEPVIGDWPPASDAGYRAVRRLLQSAFHLRELREEGEPLSVEIRVPSAEAEPPDLNLKRFAQVFGRGVGIAEGDGLADLAGPTGRLQWLWTDHAGAPMSTLYKLEKPYGKIPIGELRLVLRRDGVITLASDQNPLLEFYDGGWHTVDLAAGSAMIEGLLSRTFGAGNTASGLAQGVVSLAYHMATHWHPGILGIVKPEEASTLLEDPSQESTKIGGMILRAMKELKLPQVNLKVTEMESTGLGRVLLTCAIQDGATIFLPDGSFDSSARILKSVAPNVQGGAGTRAAKMLSKCGVAIKVSRDGAIRVFAGGPDSTILPPNGVRIH